MRQDPLELRAELARSHAEFEAAAPSPELRGVRERALAWLLELGVPSARSERWRYADLRRLARLAARPSSGPGAPVIPAPVVPGSAQLVLVDGRLHAAPAELAVAPLAARAAELGARSPRDGFAALGLAFLDAGVSLSLAGRRTTPVEVVWLGDGLGHGFVDIDVAPEAAVSLVFRRLGAGRANDTVHLTIGRGASVERTTIVEEPGATSIARAEVRLGRDARLSDQLFTLAAGHHRSELWIDLAEPGAEAHLTGLALTEGDQEIDVESTVHHRAEHTESRQLHKAVVDGESSSSFSGRVIVDEAARFTKAAQTNRNLLASPRGTANARPQLEIYAKEVECSHGSTVGQLDDDQLFYLESRGIAKADARRLLMQAFAIESLEAVRDRALRAHVFGRLASRVGSPEAGGAFHDGEG